MQVTIVIPNYNGYRFLKTCLDSLERQNFKDFRTIVIDNGSTDESCSFIEKNYSWVDLKIMDQNYGFCGGVNKGIAMCETPYVILLNNDTEVHEDFVFELLNGIKRDKKIFSCSSKMIRYSERHLMDDGGDLYTFAGWAFQRGTGLPIENFDKDKKVFSACGGAAIYSKKILDEIGYFDENHFAYLEDVDIGYRARIFGYKNVYCHKAIVYHIGSGTTGSQYNPFKVKMSSKNGIYVIYKNMPIIQIVINFIPLTIGILIKYRYYKKRGFGSDYKEGISEGFKNTQKDQKVKFRMKNLFNYILIELELIGNFFRYIIEKTKRRFLGYTAKRILKRIFLGPESKRKK